MPAAQLRQTAPVASSLMGSGASTVEFLGNKTQLLDFVIGTIEREAGGPTSVSDLFCGTASVAKGFRERGFTVAANDHLGLCSTFAESVLLNNGSPAFAGLLEQIEPEPDETAYSAVLRRLNELPSRQGFIYGNYSPASYAVCGIRRMYFTEENAQKIDAVRFQIARWEAQLTRGSMLSCSRDLIRAVSAVSNTAGTYGCYLKHWKARALEGLELEPNRRIPTSGSGHSVTCADVDVAAGESTTTVVYADPPYTKRQYAAYYHLLETIVQNDEPEISGSTGLRPWEEKRSRLLLQTTRTGCPASARRASAVRASLLELQRGWADVSRASRGDAAGLRGRERLRGALPQIPKQLRIEEVARTHGTPLPPCADLGG